MSTMIRPTSPASVQPGRLLGARQLADVVRRLAASPADWLGRVRLNPAGRWYERIHLDDSHEVWVISWLPGQATGFHDHGGSAGAFAVVWGTLMERRVVGAVTDGAGAGQAGRSGRVAGVRSPLHPRRAQRRRLGGGGERARVLAAAAGDDALRPHAGRAGQAGHRRRRRVVTVQAAGGPHHRRDPGWPRAPGCGGSRRSRPSARCPSAACSSTSGPPRSGRSRARYPGPPSWSATTWSGASIRAATPGCPGSPATTTGSS